MHILIISQYFWPENFRINDLAQGFIERGHKVTVLTGSPNYPGGKFFTGYGFFNRQEEYQGVRVVRVPLISRGNGMSLRLIANFLSFALSASILGPILCRQKFDLIFVFEPSPVTVGIPALVFKKIKSIPIMFWVQDLWPESLSATGAIKMNALLKMVDQMVKTIYKGCNQILTTSLAFHPYIARYGVDKSKIKYFPQSAENIYRPVIVSEDAYQNSLMKGGFRVVFAGNIGAAQSFKTILDAAQLTSDYGDIQWLIIGDGRMHDWVKNEISSRNLSSTVHLLGKHDVEAMPFFFALSDVLLVTLKRDPIFSLTIPGKLQSYLACGKPIVAALDGEGARIIEESRSGLTCPSEDSQGLANAIIRMYEMPKHERESMGKNAMDYYKANFDRDLLIDRLVAWMTETIADSKL